MEWVTRLLRRYLGDDHKMLTLETAKFRTDGGVGLPYKYSSKFIYKEDYIKTYANVLFDFVSKFPNGGNSMWDCFPKVEILPYNKALDKARIINGSPVETFLIGACLYSTFNEALNDIPLLAKSALGMIVSHGGWRELFDRLPDECENSDATKFDASISPKLLKMVYMVRERLSNFSEYERKLHWWYFNEIVLRRSYLSNGLVYEVYGGNGSGQYNTSSDNTIAHLLGIAYACIRINMSYREFVEFPCFVYGDDYIGRAMPESFWDVFKELGFLFKKSPPRDKMSCDFLSSRFVSTPYGVTAIPVHDKALYSSYTSEKKQWMSVRADKLYSLWLQNYFHHDRSIYEEMLESLDLKFSRKLAVDHWFGWMAVLSEYNGEKQKEREHNSSKCQR